MKPDDVPEELVYAATDALAARKLPEGVDCAPAVWRLDDVRTVLAAVLPQYDQHRLEKEFESALKSAPQGLSILEHRWRIIDDFGPYAGEFTTEADAFGQLFRYSPGAYVQVRTITEGPWRRAADPRSAQDIAWTETFRKEAESVRDGREGDGNERRHEEGGDDD